MQDNILVTDWEEVQKDDFYLTKAWQEEVGKENMKRAKELLDLNDLYIAYIVPEVHYAIYVQIDATQVFIDREMNVIFYCESAVIGNTHRERIEYNY